MIEFYTADQNMLFAVLFSIVIIFFVIELLGLLFVGLDIAGLVDSIFPDIDLSIDVDVDAGAVSKILGWLKYKEIPLILALFMLMFFFTIIGYMIQWVCLQQLGNLLSWWVPSLISIVPSILLTRVFSGVLGKILSQEDTWTLSDQDLVGKLGIITLGTATVDLPASAKVIDQHDKTHYIRVSPLDKDKEYPQGTHIITVRLDGNIYRVIEDDDFKL